MATVALAPIYSQDRQCMEKQKYSGIFQCPKFLKQGIFITRSICISSNLLLNADVDPQMTIYILKFEYSQIQIQYNQNMLIIGSTSSGSPFYSPDKIDLSHCQTTQPPKPSPTSCNWNTRHLFLTNNLISDIHCLTTMTCTQLRFLHLGLNRIQDIHPFTHTLFHNLIYLSLEGNLIRDLRQICHFDMPQLRTLYLQRNQVGNIDSLGGTSFPSLNTLDLGRNCIRSIDALLDMKAPLLSDLNLRYNLVDDFRWLLRLNFPRLRQLNTEGNVSKIDDTLAKVLQPKFGDKCALQR